MKKILQAFFLIAPQTAFCQAPKRTFGCTEGDTTYVMKEYSLVLLKSGPERSQDSAQAADI
jgi:hypothetical protein